MNKSELYELYVKISLEVAFCFYPPNDILNSLGANQLIKIKIKTNKLQFV